jgi:hypothetical protein
MRGNHYKNTGSESKGFSASKALLNHGLVNEKSVGRNLSEGTPAERRRAQDSPFARRAQPFRDSLKSAFPFIIKNQPTATASRVAATGPTATTPSKAPRTSGQCADPFQPRASPARAAQVIPRIEQAALTRRALSRSPQTGLAGAACSFQLRTAPTKYSLAKYF